MRRRIAAAVTLWGSALGLAALCVPVRVRLPLLLVYNASDSVPRGWYWIERARHPHAWPWTLHRGRSVLVQPPAHAAALAVQRGYLPGGLPLLKHIAATAPQHVCVRARAMYVDGVWVAALRQRDGQNLPLQASEICRRLVEGELMILGDVGADSFDSRYFGPIDVTAVIGLANPLWMRARR